MEKKIGKKEKANIFLYKSYKYIYYIYISPI